MDALRLPARRRRRDHPVGRRAPAGGAVPAAAVPARPAAARRAHQPPRRRVGGLAGAVPAGLPGHGRRRHPRPLLPRQRGRLDPRARPGPGHPVRGQLLVVAGAEAGPAAPGGEGRRRPAQRTLERELEWVRMSPRARQAKGKARLTAYEKLLAEAEAAERGGRQAARSPSRPAPAWATWSSRPRACRKGYGDRLLIDDLLLAAAGRHRRRHRAQRGRQDHAVPHDHRRPRDSPTPASCGSGRPSQLAYVDQSRDALDPDKHRLRGDHRRRRRRWSSAAGRCTAGPTSPASTSRAPTSRSRSATCRAASATGCTWPRCCGPAATCCCSTSPPTTSTSTPCGRSRTA